MLLIGLQFVSGRLLYNRGEYAKVSSMELVQPPTGLAEVAEKKPTRYFGLNKLRYLGCRALATGILLPVSLVGAASFVENADAMPFEHAPIEQNQPTVSGHLEGVGETTNYPFQFYTQEEIDQAVAELPGNRWHIALRTDSSQPGGSVPNMSHICMEYEAAEKAEKDVVATIDNVDSSGKMGQVARRSAIRNETTYIGNLTWGLIGPFGCVNNLTKAEFIPINEPDSKSNLFFNGNAKDFIRLTTAVVRSANTNEAKISLARHENVQVIIDGGGNTTTGSSDQWFKEVRQGMDDLNIDSLGVDKWSLHLYAQPGNASPAQFALKYYNKFDAALNSINFHGPISIDEYGSSANTIQKKTKKNGNTTMTLGNAEALQGLYDKQLLEIASCNMPRVTDAEVFGWRNEPGSVDTGPLNTNGTPNGAYTNYLLGVKAVQQGVDCSQVQATSTNNR